MSVTKTDFAWYFILVLGLFLRLRQFFINRSFWADEASLAFNLANRSYNELTQLLDYQQAAPVGFLFIEKTFIVILGNRDYILRLFPLFSGILALFLMYRIARVYLGNAGMFAVLVFSIGWAPVYYSSELKQYMSDAMISLLILYLASKYIRENASARNFLWLGGIGTVVIWISHPSVFTLAGAGLVLLLEKLLRKNQVPFLWILGIGVIWMVSFGVEYFVSLRHIVGDGFLIEYWKKAYVPLPLGSDFGWYVKTFRSFLSLGLYLHKIMYYVFIILFGIGGLSLLLKRWGLALMLSLPFVVTFIASALQRYPITERFILFLVPFALLLIAEGVGATYSVITRWNRPLALLVSGIPVAITLWFILPVAYWNLVIPFNDADIKPVMQYVGENRLPEDIVYVYHSSDPAFNYYAPFYGLDNGNVLIGFETVQRNLALQHFFEDVESLRGKDRVWFIFSEVGDCGGCEGSIQQFYVDYLNGFGTMLDIFPASGANGFLYDMNP